MKEEPRILIVEDERGIREAVERALSLKGFRVKTAEDGLEAIGAVEKFRPELVLLDVAMPKMDGLQVCRQLRDMGNQVPVLMLTARDAIADRVEGLDAGADDYLVKPFALEELLARVRALLRRTDARQEGTLKFGDLEFDPLTQRAQRGDREIVLTRTESQLLELLMMNPRQILTRSTIFDRVWGFDPGYGSNSLGVYVGYLRRKTEAGGEDRLIHTVHGVGYTLRES
jgi:two-component system, OmpR family, response regulator MprA